MTETSLRASIVIDRVIGDLRTREGFTDLLDSLDETMLAQLIIDLERIVAYLLWDWEL